ncbi:hypothetical protein EJ110_NYTH45381 [Nymphaea thermarum]|nr:hypothetical protein EJ110_NYTH45381 [Nymphaea thermarum]
MASSGLSQGLGGPSKAGRVLGPSLDKIIKNVAWRKQSQLVQACKSSLDRLQNLSTSPEFAGSSVPGFPPADADQFLASLTLALDSAAPKVIEPALECVQRLALLGLVRCDADQIDDDPASSPSPAILINSVCKCTAVADNAVELAVLRTLLSSVRSSSLGFHGDALIHIVKTFYNVYLGSTSVENRICAKAALAQTVAIVFARAEADRVEASADPVSVPALLELSDKNLNESGLVQSVQVFLIEVLEGWEGDRGSNSTAKEETGEGESRIREDALYLFKNLCKFSMKFSTQESPEDELLLRGKLLSLELMKVVVENAGPVLRVNERVIWEEASESKSQANIPGGEELEMVAFDMDKLRFMSGSRASMNCARDIDPIDVDSSFALSSDSAIMNLRARQTYLVEKS